MRAFARAAVACLALALGAPTFAQTTPPREPIPYAVYNRKFKPAKPRPRPVARLAATTAARDATTISGAALKGAIAPPPIRPGARLTPGEPIPPAELEAFVDGLVSQGMTRDHIPGLTVSIVQNGQVVFKKGYGQASFRPMRPVDPDRTLFRIGSISKTFTWIALMKEVEAGRIRLDSPINLYLPEKLQVRDESFARPVLVRHLMDHSAGFEDRALGQLFERDFERVRPLDMYLRQERPARVRPPGALSSYSNYGAGLAGAAVAYVSGQPFEALIEHEIIGPLGLARTTFREPHAAKAGLPAPMLATLSSDLAEGYRWTPEGFERRPFEYIEQIGPAGAASSTAADMSRYMLLLLGQGTLDGVTIYGPRSASAFRTPLQRVPPGLNGWPHGFIAYSLPGGWRGYGHNGATLSFTSNLVVAPDLGLGVFVSGNSDTSGPLTSRLPTAVIERFYAPARTPAVGAASVTADRDELEGVYLSTRRAYHGLEAFVGRLIGSSEVRVSKSGVLLVNDAMGQLRRFAPDAAAGERRFQSMDGLSGLQFTPAKGRAERFRDSFNAATFERAGLLDRPGPLRLLASLTGLAAAATLVGSALRTRREVRQAQTQQRANLLQNLQAGLWLVAMVGFAVFAGGASDLAKAVYGWPGGWLVTASACALVASVLTVLTLLVLPFIWRGGRRVDSWSTGRKLGFTLTVLIYGAFGLLLAHWGALAPWSG